MLNFDCCRHTEFTRPTLLLRNARVRPMKAKALPPISARTLHLSVVRVTLVAVTSGKVVMVNQRKRTEKQESVFQR